MTDQSRSRVVTARTWVTAGSAFLADLRGGVVFSVLAIGMLLPLAQLAFAPLGHDALPQAIRVTIISAIVGNLVAPLVGGVAFPNALPRTSTTLIYAALIASLVAAGVGSGGNHGDVLLLGAICVALAGVIQLVFAVIGVGSLVRYVPVSVMSGFIDGVALLILIAQIAPLAGLPVGMDVRWRDLSGGHLRAVVLGLFTAAVAYWVTRRRPRWPAALIALVTGTLVYILAQRLVPGIALGPVMGAPSAGWPQPDAIFALLNRPSLAPLREHGLRIGTTAMVIALIGTLDAMLSVAATSNVLKRPFSSRRVLVGFGLSNLLSAAYGGLPTMYTSTLAMGAGSRAGGRGARRGDTPSQGRWYGPIAALLLALLLMLGAPLLGAIPITVSAGVMVVIGISLFDDWTPRLLERVVRGRATRDVLVSLAIAIIVCVATVAFGFVAGVVAGIALALLMFVLSLNRSLIRSATTAAARTSRRYYPPDQAAAIEAAADRVHILTLEGALFFGTAEKLRLAVEELAQPGMTVIVDLGGITTIDASAAMALERMAQRLDDAHARLMLAGIAPNGRHAHVLRAFAPRLRERDWSYDVDHALERAEWEVLRDAGLLRSDLELPLETTPMLEGIPAADHDEVTRATTRREYAANDVLFRRGDSGAEVYMLTRGAVRLVEGLGDDRTQGRRIVSVHAGVMFGEVALLDGGPRTATAVFEAPSVVYALPRDALDRWSAERPELAAALMHTLANQLSARLRFATTVLWRRDAETGT